MNYDRYYSSTDTNIYITSLNNDNEQVHIDFALGVGFNESSNTTPVYSLGNNISSFYSRGNTLVNGSFFISFKNINLMNKAIRYVNTQDFNEWDKDYDPLTERDPGKMSLYKSYIKEKEKSSNFIISPSPFSILIVFDTMENNSKRESIFIKNVRINERSLSVTSNSGTVSESFSFIAQKIEEEDLNG